MSNLFLVLYKPGPQWVEGKSVFEQKLSEHGKYMKQLYDNDQLMHGGPFTDDTGGLSIFKAEDLADAEALLAKDPAILNEVFTATIHPWLSVDWDNY